MKAQITALGRRAVSVGADLSTVAGMAKLIDDGVAGSDGSTSWSTMPAWRKTPRSGT